MVSSLRESDIYIYALRDPNTMEYRYVGKSTNPLLRLESHLSEAHSENNTHKQRWLNSLDSRPNIEILQYFGLNQENWQSAECWWISEMLRRNEPLTNLTPGGDDSPMLGKHHTPETISKIVAIHLGSKRSQETKRRISEANRKRIHKVCPEGCTCRKHSERVKNILRRKMKGNSYGSYNKGLPGSFTGHYHSEETKVKMSLAKIGNKYGKRMVTNG